MFQSIAKFVLATAIVVIMTTAANAQSKVPERSADHCVDVCNTALGTVDNARVKRDKAKAADAAGAQALETATKAKAEAEATLRVAKNLEDAIQTALADLGAKANPLQVAINDGVTKAEAVDPGNAVSVTAYRAAVTKVAQEVAKVKKTGSDETKEALAKFEGSIRAAHGYLEIQSPRQTLVDRIMDANQGLAAKIAFLQFSLKSDIRLMATAKQVKGERKVAFDLAEEAYQLRVDDYVKVHGDKVSLITEVEVKNSQQVRDEQAAEERRALIKALTRD